uniref:Uncharacterized protein n=1 Tax=viral metagenome TaxID=1070528 RepID=A0A6C0I7U8_9ZZZZ
MKNEGLFLVAFIVLAIILLYLVSQREHLENPPVDSASRISTLETDFSAIDNRVSNLEDAAKKQAKDIEGAKMSVSDATASLAMIT